MKKVKIVILSLIFSLIFVACPKVDALVISEQDYEGYNIEHAYVIGNYIFDADHHNPTLWDLVRAAAASGLDANGNIDIIEIIMAENENGELEKIYTSLETNTELDEFPELDVSYIYRSAITMNHQNEDKTVLAETYTVTFDSQGGSPVEAITKPYDTEIGTLPETTKDNYTFAGWFTDTNWTTEVTSTTKVLGNVTYYAKWIPVNYTVTFDAQGGSPVEAITKPYDTEIGTLPETTKDNYTFAGWFTDTNWTTEVISTTKVLGNTTYYAKWTPILYSVCYMVNGSVYGGACSNLSYGVTITPPAINLPTGYTALGWYDADTNEQYDFSQPLNKNLTLEYRYEINAPVLSLKIDEPQHGTYGYTFTVQINSSAYSSCTGNSCVYYAAGYEIYKKNGTEYQQMISVAFPQTMDPMILVPEGTTGIYVAKVYRMDGDNKVFSGVSNELVLCGNKHTVTFEDDLGYDFESITVDDGTVIDEPTVDIPNGYVLVGWRDRNTNSLFDFSEPVTADLDLVLEYRLDYIPELINDTLIACGNNPGCTPFVPNLIDGVYEYELVFNVENQNATGYELYTKDGTTYTVIVDKDVEDSNVDVVQIEPGESKTYVVRIYEERQDGSRVYSAYSNEIVIDHSTIPTPIISKGDETFSTDEISYSNGYFNYYANIDGSYYTNNDSWSITGYIVYRKNGTAYIEIEDIDNPKLWFEFNAPENVISTYVIKAYAEKSNGDRVYSDYSNEITFDATNLYVVTYNLDGYNSYYDEDMGFGYHNMVVIGGETFSYIPEYRGYTPIGWYDADTNEPYDVNEPIYSNLNLILRYTIDAPTLSILGEYPDYDAETYTYVLGINELDYSTGIVNGIGNGYSINDYHLYKKVGDIYTTVQGKILSYENDNLMYVTISTTNQTGTFVAAVTGNVNPATGLASHQSTYSNEIELDPFYEYCVEVNGGMCGAVLKGETLDVPEYPNYAEGYNFIGWYDKDTNAPYDFTQPISKDLTVVLMYTLDTPTLSITNEVGDYNAQTYTYTLGINTTDYLMEGQGRPLKYNLYRKNGTEYTLVNSIPLLLNSTNTIDITIDGSTNLGTYVAKIGVLNPITEEYDFGDYSNEIELNPYYEYCVEVNGGVCGSKLKGEVFEAPEYPEMPDGYTILGWYDEDTNAPYDFTQPMSKDLTIVFTYSVNAPEFARNYAQEVTYNNGNYEVRVGINIDDYETEKNCSRDVSDGCVHSYKVNGYDVFKKTGQNLDLVVTKEFDGTGWGYIDVPVPEGTSGTYVAKVYRLVNNQKDYSPESNEITLTGIYHRVEFSTGLVGHDIGWLNVEDGETVDDPGEALPDGYTFVGWYNHATNTPYDFDQPVTTDLVLDLVYTINAPELTVSNNGVNCNNGNCYVGVRINIDDYETAKNCSRDVSDGCTHYYGVDGYDVFKKTDQNLEFVVTKTFDGTGFGGVDVPVPEDTTGTYVARVYKLVNNVKDYSPESNEVTLTGTAE